MAIAIIKEFSARPRQYAAVLILATMAYILYVHLATPLTALYFLIQKDEHSCMQDYIPLWLIE